MAVAADHKALGEGGKAENRILRLRRDRMKRVTPMTTSVII
jgi:hypothetical protein